MPRVVVIGDNNTPPTLAAPPPPRREDDHPPLCPVCRHRFVMIAMHPGRDAAGNRIRRQFWGCPAGHASAYRTGGHFGDIDIYTETDDE